MKTALVRQRNLPCYIKNVKIAILHHYIFTTEFYETQYNIWDMIEIMLEIIITFRKKWPIYTKDNILNKE